MFLAIGSVSVKLRHYRKWKNVLDIYAQEHIHFMMLFRLMLLSTIIVGGQILSAPPGIHASQSYQQAVPQQQGRIKGVVTYYFNANYGDKPDVGSVVLLFADKVDISTNEFVVIGLGGDKVMEILSDTPKSTRRDVTFLDSTRVDASGSFSFDSVAPGLYTVFIQSSHSKGKESRDFLHRIVCLHVEVTLGRTVDASESFPATV